MNIYRIYFGLLIIFFISSNKLNAQSSIDQNGLQSTVTNYLSANATQAKRFEIAKVLYNSHHWQNSSIIIVELFNIHFQSGYEKYIIEIGYGQGTGTSQPKISFVDSKGINHNAKITLGDPEVNVSEHSGYPNKTISIYADIRYYSQYKAKVTHLRNKVSTLTAHQQILINESPISIDIDDFQAPIVDNNTSYWYQTGENLYYKNMGNVGIGTTTPDSKLAVNGTIHSKEVKVDLTGWSDFVFESNYNLPTLQEVESYIKEKGHLRDIPSAKEVENEGVLLGEMNARLLKKIEELTLYAIDQERRMKELEEQNIKINELENKLNLILKNEKNN